MRDKLQQFMSGRYGVDGLGKATMVLALICVVLNLFLPGTPFYILGVVFLIISYIRMLSRNTTKRYAENQWFANKFARVKGWFSKRESYRNLQKDHRIYACPSCHQKVKVPKGKGRISIHCPKCGTDFIKKS